MIKQRPEPVGLVHRLQKREEKMNIHIYMCVQKSLVNNHKEGKYNIWKR